MPDAAVLQEIARRLAALPFFGPAKSQEILDAVAAGPDTKAAAVLEEIRKAEQRLETDPSLHKALKDIGQLARAKSLELHTRRAKTAARDAETDQKSNEGNPDDLLAGL